MCAQDGVRSDIVAKEKGVFHVSVRTNSEDAFSQFVCSFLAALVTCSEVEAGNFTISVCSVFLNVGKCVLKMTETLWENSLVNSKEV
jgi:hypothetical protein